MSLFTTPREVALEREITILKRRLERHEDRPSIQFAGEPIKVREMVETVDMMRTATWGVCPAEDDPHMYHILGRVHTPNAAGLSLHYDYYLDRTMLHNADQATILTELHRVMVQDIASKL